MKVFALIRKLLSLVGLFDFNPIKITFLTAILICISFFLIIYGAVSEIWFMVFEARTFDDSAKACTSLIVCTYVFMVSSAIRLRRNTLGAMFKAMETLFRERK